MKAEMYKKPGRIIYSLKTFIILIYPTVLIDSTNMTLDWSSLKPLKRNLNSLCYVFLLLLTTKKSYLLVTQIISPETNAVPRAIMGLGV